MRTGVVLLKDNALSEELAERGFANLGLNALQLGRVEFGVDASAVFNELPMDNTADSPPNAQYDLALVKVGFRSP